MTEHNFSSKPYNTEFYYLFINCVCLCVCVGGVDGSGGGGGFFLACEDFGRMFDISFPACAFFFFFNRDKLAQTNSTL